MYHAYVEAKIIDGTEIRMSSDSATEKMAFMRAITYRNLIKKDYPSAKNFRFYIFDSESGEFTAEGTF